MKVANVTVAELRSNFKSVEAKLAKGVRVQVMRRGEIVAEMLPPGGEPVGPSGSRTRFVEVLRDREVWLSQIWGDQPVDIDTTALISEGRDRALLS